MSELMIYTEKEKKIIKTAYGPISFGWVLSGNIVSWSAKQAKDLLIGRCWEGLYLYPTKNLEDHELDREPLKICGALTGITMGYPFDWNKDGKEDLLLSDRRGFLYLLEVKEDYPDMSTQNLQFIKDRTNGLAFNIPYENPNFGERDSLGGYIDLPYYNYIYPMVYPSKSTKMDLIVGDSAGNLWWMADESDGTGVPLYHGVKYQKDKEKIGTADGKKHFELLGDEYVKPVEKICDENGEPFLLGEGFEVGTVFPGGNTRPVLYENDQTGMYDLLVLAGTKTNRLYHLANIGKTESGKPVFENRGEIVPDSIDVKAFEISGAHSKIIVDNTEGRNDLLMSMDNKLAVLKNKKANRDKPQFAFDRFISSKNVPTSGYNFTEILTDIHKKRYLLDNPNHLELREIEICDHEVRLSSKRIKIMDQYGIFKPEGETDPQGLKDWGFHRASKWDFDKSGGQHLIVGTDKGLLYLLIEEKPLGTDGKYEYRTEGPLKDMDGNIIKVHNRVCAGGIDLNGDGIEDLVVGGITYQLGFKTDPNPGGGFYFLINRGVNDQGVPMLERIRPLKTIGHTFDFKTNSHVHMQTLDQSDQGGKRIILSNQKEGFKGRIFAPAGKDNALQYTNKMIDQLSIDDRLLDIDDDGRLEHIFGGGEQGIVYYRELRTMP